MTTSKAVVRNTGQTFPIAGLLGVALVVLKLTHVIAWSWLWVLAPFWIPFAVPLAFIAVGAVFVGLFYLASHAIGRGK